MKLKTLTALLALAAVSTLNSQLSTVHAQGSLTPPTGAPAPVMKSLDQIEARTPVNTLTGNNTALYAITNSGSYYLTAPVFGGSNVKIGIFINANDVTLDLNGFSVAYTNNASVSAYPAIEIATSRTNITILNGNLAGFASGIDCEGSAFNVRITSIAIALPAALSVAPVP